MSIRLFVLGILNERDAHGYEFKRLAREADLAQWAEIGYGSIYHALRRLENEMLIEEISLEQEGAYPQRTVYRITEAGRRAFRKLLQETCRTVYEPKYPIDLALVFIGQLPPAERVALLQERLRQLEATQNIVAKKRAYLTHTGPEFASLRAILDHDITMRNAEMRWMRELIAQVQGWPASALVALDPAD